MIPYHVFCCCTIFFASFEGIICPLEDFNIDVPALDVTLVYTRVRCLESGVKNSMFVFRKNDECRDVYEQVGRSAEPDEQNIYLSTLDITEPSSMGNIVTFHANNKDYVIVFSHANEAIYFMNTMNFEEDFKVVYASETSHYTELKLTSFVNAEKQLHFQFENSSSKIYFKYADVSKTEEDAWEVTLRKTNGLKEYKITFARKDHKNQFVEFF